MSICFYGWCCPPCLYGENAQKIDGSGCCGACCVYSCLAGCDLCWIVHMGKRQALRQRYGLDEDCNDCLATAFCPACAICQEARELKFREVGVGYSGMSIRIQIRSILSTFSIFTCDRTTTA